MCMPTPFHGKGIRKPRQGQDRRDPYTRPPPSRARCPSSWRRATCRQSKSEGFRGSQPASVPAFPSLLREVPTSSTLSLPWSPLCLLLQQRTCQTDCSSCIALRRLQCAFSEPCCSTFAVEATGAAATADRACAVRPLRYTHQHIHYVVRHTNK